jgi:LPS sulfotransferase NodH
VGELPPITAEQAAEAQALFPLPKFFIFGYPRSGTTLLARLLRLHPQVHCNWQAHFFTHEREDATRVFVDAEARAWLARRNNRWTTGQNLDALLVRLLADFIMEREARQLGKAVVGDKTPNNNAGQAVTRLQRVYPDAWLIYIVRDGRDAAVSHRFQLFIDRPQDLSRADLRLRTAFGKDSQPFFERRRSIFTRTALQREAQAWAQNVTETHRLGQELFGARYLALRYEDLLADPAAVMRQVWAFLPVQAGFERLEEQVAAEMASNPSADWHMEKEAHLARNLRRGQPGSWRDFFAPQDSALFKRWAGQALLDWHYETGMDW